MADWLDREWLEADGRGGFASGTAADTFSPRKPTAVLTLGTAVREHWPEYLMEAVEIATFMMSACLVVALFDHPTSPFNHIIPNPTVRRILTGVAMGVTAIAIVYSPWGQQSGAHFNPSVTLTFWRLGKVAGWDAVFYLVAHFVGATLGVLVAAVLLGDLIAHPAVRYVATLPRTAGPMVAMALSSRRAAR
jgi:aquaporin Z